MNTLSLFSEKEREYFAYQARQDFLRKQYTIKADLAHQEQKIELMRIENEQAWREKLAAEQRETEAKQRETKAQAEIAQLKALLAQRNK